MRLFSRSLFLCLLLAGGILPVRSQTSTATLPPQVEATNLLLHGRRYEHAAEQMQAAIAVRPDDYAAYLALGCAHADRAAALAYAEMYTKMLKEAQKTYPDTLKEWEEAQKDKDDYRYGDPRPKPPPTMVFPTRDDNVPYSLTHLELAARLSELFVQAQAAWDKAASLAKTDAERAQVEWVRGWGMRLLVVSSDAVGGPKETIEAADEPDEDANDREVGASPKPKEPPLTIKNVPTKKQIAAAFAQAVALAPEEARYWQSLGDWETSDEKKAKAYEKSLALQPKNGLLWAELYRRTLNETYTPDPNFLLKPDAKKANVEKGVGYLGRAAKYDPTNAWYIYEEAALRMKREMFSNYLYTRRGPSDGITPEAAQKAVQSETSRQTGRAVVALIEAGNQRYEFRPPRYTPAVPGLLFAGWDYLASMNETNWEYSSRLRELARAVSGYGLAEAIEGKNLPEALYASQAVTQMGLKLAGDWPLKDKKGTSLVLQTLVGRSIASIGLANVVKIYDAVGDRGAKASAQKEVDNLRDRAKNYSTAVFSDNMSTWEMYFQ